MSLRTKGFRDGRAVIAVRFELGGPKVAELLVSEVDPDDGRLTRRAAEVAIRAALAGASDQAGADWDDAVPGGQLAGRAEWAVDQIRRLWPALDGPELAAWLGIQRAEAAQQQARRRLADPRPSRFAGSANPNGGRR